MTRKCPLQLLLNRPEHPELLDLSEGRRLHARVEDGGVHAARWCVTQRDLRMFRELIVDCLNSNLLRPTDLDKFDAESCGPNMYTLNGQMIKPLTAMVGGMSWALWRHPEGLPCELFITHAWAEGCFEFLEKVLDSWPSGPKHAYICFLANPQNLDISGLISSPSTSPFAMALSNASVMLVVPNHIGSIYTRLWCAYEAFKACEAEKDIYTAKPLRTCSLLKAGLNVVPSILLGCSVYVWVYSYLDGKALPLPIVFMYPLSFMVGIVCAYSMRDSLTHKLCNHVFLGFNSGTAIVWAVVDPGDTMSGEWFIPAIMILAIVAEMSRIQDSINAEEVRQLCNFASIRHAQCSCQSDDDSIRGEIESATEVDAWHRVDNAITVLLESGKSTRSLRLAAIRGVNVVNAGRARPFPCVMAYLCQAAMCARFGHRVLYDSTWGIGLKCAYASTAVLWTVMTIIFTVRLFLTDPSHRDVMVNGIGGVLVISGFLWALMFIPGYVFIKSAASHLVWQLYFAATVNAIIILIVVAMFLLSFVDLGTIAAWPRWGPTVAQALLAPGAFSRIAIWLNKNRRVFLFVVVTSCALLGFTISAYTRNVFGIVGIVSAVVIWGLVPRALTCHQRVKETRNFSEAMVENKLHCEEFDVEPADLGDSIAA